MEEEVRLHLELREERYVAAGMNSEAAREAARKSFGGVDQIKERCRDERHILWVDHLIQDVRYAFRQFLKKPKFASIAVLSLASGIGVTTAVFSLVDAKLLKSTLQVKRPEDLVNLYWLPGVQGSRPKYFQPDPHPIVDSASGQIARHNFSRRFYESVCRENDVFEDAFATGALWVMNVKIDNQTEIVPSGQLVTGNFYKILGITASLGRTLSPSDDVQGAEPVCVISNHYWLTRFGGDRGVIGKSIVIDGATTTVVGVSSRGFTGTTLIGSGSDITLPLSMAPRVRFDSESLNDPSYWWLNITGRLKPNVSIQQARLRLSGIFRETANLDVVKKGNSDLPRLGAAPGGRNETESDRKGDISILIPMLGIVSIVFLVACANVANLFLARNASRKREFAVRAALGASRYRIVRQLLTESLLLSLLGASLGLLLAKWDLHLLASIFPPDVGDWLRGLNLNLNILCFTIALSLLSGIVFGLTPALRVARLNLIEEFQGGSRVLGQARTALKKIFLVSQIALSVVLLVFTGLFLRTLSNLRSVDLGFGKEHLLTFMVIGETAGYKPDQYIRLHENISELLGAVPGVKSVSYSGSGFLSGEQLPSSLFYRADDHSERATNEYVAWDQVGLNFFKTYEMPIVVGRAFGPNDDEKSPLVAVVNQAFVNKYFHDEYPVGRRINLEGNREVVGVVRDAKLTNEALRGITPPTVYLPFSQRPQGHSRFAIRTEAEPETLIATMRKVLSEFNPNMAITSVATQDQLVEERFLKERMFSSLSAFVGFIAIALASVGLFGLISESVVQRTNEIGIRMALGGSSVRMAKMILRESLRLIGAGLVAGSAFAIATTRLVSSKFFGVSFFDPLTYLIVASILLLVGLAACWIPAYRATKIDPMVALRCD
jgi:predicted permease